MLISLKKKKNMFIKKKKKKGLFLKNKKYLELLLFVLNLKENVKDLSFENCLFIKAFFGKIEALKSGLGFMLEGLYCRINFQAWFGRLVGNCKGSCE